MKWSLCIFLLFSFITLLQAKDVITLKSGMVVEGEIERVNSWGFNLKDNRSVLFNLLQSVITDKKQLGEEVIHFLPDIEIIAQEDSTFLLNFQTVKFPPKKIKEDNTLKFAEYRLITTFSSLKADRYNIGISSIFSKYLLLRIGFGYSEYSTQYNYEYRDYWSVRDTTEDREYKIYGPSFGIGIHIENEKNQLSLIYNYSFKVIKRDFDKKPAPTEEKFDQASSVELVYHRTSIWQQIVLAFGIKYYFNRISVINNDSRTGLNIGVGWHF